MDSHGPSTSSRVTKPIARLSCEMCRQRKTRCDKLAPCSSCLRLGVACTPIERPRLPRGRHRLEVSSEALPGHPPGLASPPSSTANSSVSRLEADLQSRVAQLEQFIRRLAPGTEVYDRFSSPSAPSGVAERPGPEEPQSAESRHFVQHWSRLEREMAGSLDNVIEEGEPRITRPETNFASRLVFDQGDKDGLLSTNTIDTELPRVQKSLAEVFFLHVDPVFKVIHRPSVSIHLLEGKSYLDYEAHHPAVEALDRAIYYAGVCSLADDQCLAILNVPKSTAIPIFRQITENALAAANLTTTEDITVFQALLIYLVTAPLFLLTRVPPYMYKSEITFMHLLIPQVATRSHDRGRHVWSIMGLALRIAQALFIDMDYPPIPSRPFDIEMRRRMRFALALLDMQTSFDWASRLIVPLSWVESSAPMHVNEDDFDISLESPVSEVRGFTDMTFPLLVCKAQLILRRIDPTTNPNLTPDMQQKYITEFVREVSLLVLDCDTEHNPFHWYTREVAIWIVAQMRLLAARPLHRYPNQNSAPVGFNLLLVSVEILQRSRNLVEDARGQKWRWYERIFNPWHVLSVALAELCVCDNLDTVEQCWETVDWGYLHCRDLMARSLDTSPWGPTERLMRKARAKRSSLYLQRSRQSTSHSTKTSASSSIISSTHEAPVAGDSSPSLLSQQTANVLRPLQTPSSFVPTGSIPPTAQVLSPGAPIITPMQTDVSTPALMSVVDWMGSEPFRVSSDEFDLASMDTSWANWESFLDDFR